MQIEALKLLGLPVLEAQLHTHRLIVDKAIKIINSKPVASRVEILVFDKQGSFTETFYFPNLEEAIPIEFRQCLENFAQRLCAEKWELEQAIQELRQNNLSTN
jgi:hypothetical protein